MPPYTVRRYVSTLEQNIARSSRSRRPHYITPSFGSLGHNSAATLRLRRLSEGNTMLRHLNGQYIAHAAQPIAFCIVLAVMLNRIRWLPLSV
jgi:hypothetical protein